jgi:MFS family permease
MGVVSNAVGRAIDRRGARTVMALGTVLVAGVDADSGYWLDIFPGVTVFGLGLALMVAPLTATVLAAAPDENAGIASGINNAVARAGSLLAIAALPVAVGLGGDDYTEPAVFDSAFQSAILICAVLLVLGGIVSWFTIPASLQEAATDSSAV